MFQFAPNPALAIGPLSQWSSYCRMQFINSNALVQDGLQAAERSGNDAALAKIKYRMGEKMLTEIDQKVNLKVNLELLKKSMLSLEKM